MALTALQRWKLNLLVAWFGFMEVPLIGSTGIRVVDLDDDKCVLLMPLKRRNKNHLNSMYFGALAIGADTAGALFALLENRRRRNAVSLVFKDFQAEFHKRAEAATLFTSTDGAAIRTAFDETMRTGERVNVGVKVTATVPTEFGTEPVAIFRLTLSLKRRPAQ